MFFAVGQKVVRVSGENIRGVRVPAFGEVCTVVTQYSAMGEPMIELAEYPDKPANCWPGFRAKHFRPVIERKTDISIVTELLDPARRQLEPTL